MQTAHYETSEQPQYSSNASSPSSSNQYGFPHHELSGTHRVRSSDTSIRSRSSSPRSVVNSRGSHDAVDADKLDEKLRGLSFRGNQSAVNCRQTAGQRVSDHENALTPSTPRQALGFKVIRRSASSNGMQLTDFPNEILTHILSHLHPDSHGAVALVSKRLYALVTTPHAWRMAFMRYFPGHTCLDTRAARDNDALWTETTSDLVRSDVRFFARLTALATWRSEYLFRTRLMRSLAKGKPGTSSGGIGSSGPTGKSAKRRSAVLTYNSKLPWLITNIHAVFSNGKKPPRAIQGTGDLGVATMSDPTTGKIEKWGLTDPFSSAQLEEIAPNMVPYGLGDGPVAVPNTMDVSQPYGVISGEGFPGGRAYFRAANESTGRYLGADTRVADTYPDVPKIPEMSDSICSVWIAKSSAVPATTQSMCGILTGSALGIVTAYSLGWDSSGPRYASGDMTARWILSPGVPIISLRVDDNYNVKRKSSARAWAVALNALGEVYYLADTPAPTVRHDNGDNVTRQAWLAGRTAYWHLLEQTRRTAKPEDLDKNATRGSYTPRSPSNDMHLRKEQLIAEAREIEKYLFYKPSHFRKVCENWDMQRRLEVDFANDDGTGAGEGIFVIDCGLTEKTSARVLRYTRSLTAPVSQQGAIGSAPITTASTPVRIRSSLFGSADLTTTMDLRTPEPQSPHPPPPTPMSPVRSPVGNRHNWACTTFELGGIQQTANITTSCLDCSSYSMLTLGEDPLYIATESTMFVAAPATKATTSLSSKVDQATTTEIPGRRARFLAIGTNTGAVIVWSARQQPTRKSAQPVRIIQTESPKISSLAASALYLVHGGSDGLVQAWDPLASTMEPIRTLNSRSNGRIPRHMLVMNPTLHGANFSAVGAIYLDPDPTVLRGVLSFGAFIRYWTYSSTGHAAGRKRRVRHSDIHGRIASRRLGGTVGGYIAAEEAELRRENEARAREQMRLRKRFGVGALGDLTEEEAIRYAQMVSEEAYLQDGQRRASDSTPEADFGMDTASSFSETTTTDTVTPEPSVTDVSPPLLANAATDDDSEFEQQIQQAIRLSLLEGVNDIGQSPRGNSSSDFEFSIKVKSKAGRKAKSSGSRSNSPTSTSHTQINDVSATGGSSKSLAMKSTEDEDLALALSLSLQEQEATEHSVAPDGCVSTPEDEFPPLDTEGIGKGKGVRRW